MVLKAMRLDTIIRGLSIDRKEKGSKDSELGIPKCRGWQRKCVEGEQKRLRSSKQSRKKSSKVWHLGNQVKKRF